MRYQTASLVLALALAAAPLAGSLPASARAAPRVAAVGAPIVVDVARLRALGLGPTADLVERTIASELRDHALPAGGRLVVRVTGLSMSSYAGSDTGGGGSAGNGGATNNDYMEGEALIVGPRGEIVSRYPLVTNQPSSTGGAYYLPGAEQRRIIALSRNFVLWIERQLG